MEVFTTFMVFLEQMALVSLMNLKTGEPNEKVRLLPHLQAGHQLNGISTMMRVRVMAHWMLHQDMTQAAG